MPNKPIEPIRIPLPSVLASRDATMAKDGLLTNCYREQGPEGEKIVKRPGLSTIANLGIGCAQGAITFNGNPVIIQQDTLYEYIPGGWMNTSGSFSGIFSMVGFNGTLFAISDGNSYSSTDLGRTWTTLGAPAWPTDVPLHGALKAQAAINFNSAIYVAVQTSSGYTIWTTTNCVSWTKTATITPGNVSIIIGLVVLGSTAYLITGSASNNDLVYSSVNGATWTPIFSGTAWHTNAAAPVVNNGNIYVMSAPNNVFISATGSSWTLLTASAGFGTLTNQPAVWSLSNTLYLGGGQLAAAGFQFYSSLDGINWQFISTSNPQSPISSRFDAGYTVFNNVLWIAAGKISNIISASGVWSYPGIFPFPAGQLPPTSCEPYQLALFPAHGNVPLGVFFKNNDVAYFFDGTTITRVTNANYPSATVPGVAYLDGSVYVLQKNGQINGSNLNDPLMWQALNFVSAISEAGNAIFITRQLIYIVVFKEYSIEFWYDAGTTPSPLGVVPNANLEIGCASFGSIVNSDNTIFFMAQSKQQGRSIQMLEGFQNKVISTDFINRILNADDLANVFAFNVKSEGHFFYILTLLTSNITLAYDMLTQEWHRWTNLTPNAALTTASFSVQSDGSVLINMALPHGLGDGDPVTITGFTQSVANGTFAVAIVSTLAFSYFPTSVLSSLTGTPLVVTYNENAFPGVYYAFGGINDFLVDRTSGQVYIFSPSITGDSSYPINTKMRTMPLDFGSMMTKRINQIELIGDNITTNVLIHYSDDDYQTFSTYEIIPMSYDRALLTGQGSTRKRVYELRHIDQTPLRLIALEAMIDIGAF